VERHPLTAYTEGADLIINFFQTRRQVELGFPFLARETDCFSATLRWSIHWTETARLRQRKSVDFRTKTELVEQAEIQIRTIGDLHPGYHRASVCAIIHDVAGGTGAVLVEYGGVDGVRPALFRKQGRVNIDKFSATRMQSGNGQ